MGSLPVVIAQRSQPTTLGQGASLSKPPPPSKPQYIVFRSEDERYVEVLAGEGAPTISDGYAKWVAVPRPQRPAITVFSGYEPLTLKVPILFANNPSEQNDLESAIGELEHFARPGASQGQAEPHEAGYNLKTQLLRIYAKDGRGNEVPLVPGWVQGIPFVITGIEWDANPERNAQGQRIRQAGVVTLWGFLGSLYEQDELKQLRAKIAKEKPVVFITTSAVNTVKRIAAHYGNPSSTAWQEIIKANYGNKRVGGNPEKHLPVGTRVKVPKLVLKPTGL
jgi:hypothetical protein